MGLLFAEAIGALFILVLIVWWTMFHGRKGGERKGIEREEIEREP